MDMQYQLVVFDWDGTLVDSAERIVSCLRYASQKVGLPLLSDGGYCDVIGLGMPEAIKQLYPALTETNIRRFIDAYRNEFLDRCQDPPPLFDGVSDLLASLRGEGYSLAVATGKSRKGLAGELDVRDIADFFIATRCADETRSKPDPMMLDQLMGELRCDAAEVLMIGDSVYDMKMAANAGVDRLAVTWGVHDRDRLVSFNPVLVADRVSEIETFLLSL
ncbi:MAG: HAD-IIIA family hydrolase [Endozoicomonadaceae bacterium]|nr:HAD-IIIA family hydrolase [Endozoicomonadaceae bacterium]